MCRDALELFPKLEIATLKHASMSDSANLWFADDHPNLRSLELDCCQRTAVASILGRCPDLTALKLGPSLHMNPQALDHLFRLASLHTLEWHNPVINAGTFPLDRFADLHSLHRLKFAATLPFPWLPPRSRFVGVDMRRFRRILLRTPVKHVHFHHCIAPNQMIRLLLFPPNPRVRSPSTRPTGPNPLAEGLFVPERKLPCITARFFGARDERDIALFFEALRNDFDTFTHAQARRAAAAAAAAAAEVLPADAMATASDHPTTLPEPTESVSIGAHSSQQSEADTGRQASPTQKSQERANHHSALRASEEKGASVEQVHSAQAAGTQERANSGSALLASQEKGTNDEAAGSAHAASSRAPANHRSARLASGETRAAVLSTPVNARSTAASPGDLPLAADRCCIVTAVERWQAGGGTKSETKAFGNDGVARKFKKLRIPADGYLHSNQATLRNVLNFEFHEAVMHSWRSDA